MSFLIGSDIDLNKKGNLTPNHNTTHSWHDKVRSCCYSQLEMQKRGTADHGFLRRLHGEWENPEALQA